MLNVNIIKIGRLFSLFEEYIVIMTLDHNKSCACNFCLASLELFKDGSGGLIIDDDPDSSFDFDTVDEGIAEFTKILSVLDTTNS